MTGGGRAIVERLAVDGRVVAIDRDAEAIRWTEGRDEVIGPRRRCG